MKGYFIHVCQKCLDSWCARLDGGLKVGVLQKGGQRWVSFVGVEESIPVVGAHAYGYVVEVRTRRRGR